MHHHWFTRVKFWIQCLLVFALPVRMLDRSVCHWPSRSSIASIGLHYIRHGMSQLRAITSDGANQPANTLSTTLTCSINNSSLSRRPMSCTWQGALSTSLGRSVPVSRHDSLILDTVNLFLTRRNVLDISHKLGVGSLICSAKGDGAGRVLIHRQHHFLKNSEGSRRG